MLKKILPLLSISLFFCVSCQEFSQSIRETYEPSPSDETLSQDLKEDAGKSEESRISVASSIEALQLAEDALRNLPQFRNKPIVIFSSMHFYDDGRIGTEIQDPDNPEFIDAYTYRDGEWLKGKPVVITQQTRVEEKLVPLGNVSLLAAHRIYHTVKEKVAEIGGDRDSNTVYFVVNRGEVRWYPRSLRTPRARYSIEFDGDGNLVHFERD